MANDLARLGVIVDFKSAKDAREELGKLKREGGQVERQFGDTARATDRFNDRMERGTRATSRFTQGLDNVLRRMTPLITATTALVTAFAGLQSIKFAANFESEFTKVETLLDNASFATGNFQKNIDGLKSGILELRSTTGDTFENLTKGLFDLISAGVKAEDSIRVLGDANKLAKAGVTDVSVAVDGLTTTLNAYGEAAERSEVLSSKFFTAQKFGKTTVEELARGLGQVAPLAAQLGVSFDELLASQAAATASGIRQSEAYTGLKAALTNIVKPAQDAVEEAKRLGVEFDSAALKAKGFTQFLADIRNSTEFTDESFQKLFTSAEGLNFVLAITGGGAGVYAKTLQELGDETKSVATLNEAYQRAIDDTAEKQKRLQGTVQDLIIAYGAGLAPVFGELVDQFNEFLRGDDFAARLQGIQSGVAASVQVLADNWGIVSKSITAATTALTLFLGLQVASNVATVLKLASAWATVEKSIKAAAASIVLLGTASGATGLKALVVGTGAFVAQLGKAVTSVGALRGAIALLSRTIASVPGVGWIIGMVTALVTFRKEISDVITGTRDLGVAFQAVGNVALKRIEPLINMFEEVAKWAKAASEAISNLIPDVVKESVSFLVDKLGELINLLARLASQLPGFKQSFDFISDVRDEVDRIEANQNQPNSSSQRNIPFTDISTDKIINAPTEVTKTIFENLNKGVKIFNDLLEDGRKKLEAEASAAKKLKEEQEAAREAAAERSKVQKENLDEMLKELEIISQASTNPDELRFQEELLRLKNRYRDVDDDILENAARRIILAQDEIYANEEINRLIEAQRQLSRDFAIQPLTNLLDGLTYAYEDFWDNFVDKGFKAVEDLGKSLKNVFKQLASDLLKSLFSSALLGIQSSIFGGITGAAGAAGQASAGGIFTPGIIGPSGLNFGALTQALPALAGFGVGGGAANFFGLASLIGPANLGVGAAALGNFIGLPGGVTDVFGEALAGAGTFGGALGGIGGSLLSGALFGNSTGQQIGSTIGGIAGNLIPIPVLGPLIGSFLGGAIGSLFSGKPSGNQAGTNINLDDFSVYGSFAKNNNPENIRDRDQIVSTALQALNQIKELTGSGFSDKANLVVTVSSRASEGIQVNSGPYSSKFAREDVEGATRAAINQSLQLLGGDGSGNTLSRFVRELAKVDTPFEKILESTQKLAAVLESTNEPLSQWQQRLKTIRDEIQPLIDQMDSLGVSSQEVKKILADAEQAITKDFNESVRKNLLQITSPLAAQFEELFDAQKRLVEDAIAVGGDLDQVMELNRAAFEQFLEQAKQTPGSLTEISEQFEALAEKARELGQDVAPVEQAFAEVAQTLRETFNDDINQQLLQLQNPVLAAFNALLKQQQSRVDASTAVGGNTTAVERLNALERQKFFENLSDEEKLQLGDFLGLIEDFSGRIAYVLSALQSNFDKFIDNLGETTDNLLSEANAFLDVSQSIGSTRQSIYDQFNPSSPNDQLIELRGRFNDLTQQALSGDLTAAQGLPDLANLLIERSRQYFASSDTFQNDFNSVINALSDVEAFTKGQSDSLFSEAERAQAELDAVIEIRDILGQPDPNTELLASMLDQGAITNDILGGLLSEYIDLANKQLEQDQLTIDQLQSSSLTSLSTTSATSTSPILVQLENDDNTEKVVTALDTVNNSISSGLAVTSAALSDLADEIRRDRLARATENQ